MSTKKKIKGSHYIIMHCIQISPRGPHKTAPAPTPTAATVSPSAATARPLHHAPAAITSLQCIAAASRCRQAALSAAGPQSPCKGPSPPVLSSLVAVAGSGCPVTGSVESAYSRRRSSLCLGFAGRNEAPIIGRLFLAGPSPFTTRYATPGPEGGWLRPSCHRNRPP
jgi:hypothetical protein